MHSTSILGRCLLIGSKARALPMVLCHATAGSPTQACLTLPLPMPPMPTSGAPTDETGSPDQGKTMHYSVPPCEHITMKIIYIYIL